VRARVLGAIVFFVARGALAQDEVEDVIVRGEQAQGFESRTTVESSPREVTDVASLLEPLVGLHVRRLGADDGFATLSIRGSGSNEVAFYLAGVPLPSAADPTVDLSTLPLWPGTRARVHRTFTPAALGPGSLGGTLSIDPPSATGPERTDLWMAGGSFGDLRMRAADVSDLGRGVRLATGFSASRQDGDFTFWDPARQLFVPRLNDDFAQASALASLVVPMHPGTMRATAMLQAREQGLPGTIFVATPAQRLRTDRELATIELAWPAPHGTVGAQLWTVRQGTDFRDVPETPLDASLETTSIVTAGGNASYRGRFGNVQIASKLDARAERYEPGDYVGPFPPSGATRGAVGLGADAEWRPTRAIAADASARFDGWYDAASDPTIPSGFDARPTAHAGIDARAGSFSFAAHGGYTARPANFVERFGTPGGFIPSPDLQPESAFTIDAGGRFKKRFGKLKLEAELDGFGQLAQDLITFETVSARQLPKATNIGRAALAGVEAELGARFFGFEIRASYTGLHTENDADYLPDHPSLPGRPAHDFVGDVAYAVGPLRLRWGIDVVAGVTLDEPGKLEVPARALQSAGFRLDVARGVRVALDVRNLFDVRTAGYYQQFNNTTIVNPIGDVYDYPLPGRSILLSLAWQPRELAPSVTRAQDAAEHD
jgi:hypothetical protein